MFLLNNRVQIKSVQALTCEMLASPAMRSMISQVRQNGGLCLGMNKRGKIIACPAFGGRQ